MTDECTNCERRLIRGLQSTLWMDEGTFAEHEKSDLTFTPPLPAAS